MPNEFTSDFNRLLDSLECGFEDEIRPMFQRANAVREQWESYWAVKHDLYDQIVLLGRKCGAFDEPEKDEHGVVKL